MFSKIKSFGVSGVGGYEVDVEVFISNGLPGFDIVGLPDTAVKEARERVRSAIKNNGFRFPVSRLTVNLAPADKKKMGTVYDLPILMGILSAAGELERLPEGSAFFGELSLLGELRPVPGALPMALAAARAGIKELYLPAANAAEAAFAQGITVYPAESLARLIAHLKGEKPIAPASPPDIRKLSLSRLDFSDVKGQENVKRAMEIAAAGGHNIPGVHLFQGLQPGKGGTGEGAVRLNICKDNILYSNFHHKLCKLQVVQSRVLHPARGPDSAVLGVDPHRDALPIALRRSADKIRVAHRSRANNGPPHPGLEHRLQVLHAPDAAPQLHLETGAGGDLRHDPAVDSGASPGSVQVHHMDPAGTGLGKGTGGLQWVLGHLVDLVEIPLVKANYFSVF